MPNKFSFFSFTLKVEPETELDGHELSDHGRAHSHAEISIEEVGKEAAGSGVSMAIAGRNEAGNARLDNALQEHDDVPRFVELDDVCATSRFNVSSGLDAVLNHSLFFLVLNEIIKNAPEGAN